MVLAVARLPPSRSSVSGCCAGLGALFSLKMGELLMWTPGDRLPAQTVTYIEQPEHDNWTGVRWGALLSDEDTLGCLRGSNTGKATGHGLCSPAPTRRLIPSCIKDSVKESSDQKLPTTHRAWEQSRGAF